MGRLPSRRGFNVGSPWVQRGFNVGSPWVQRGFNVGGLSAWHRLIGSPLWKWRIFEFLKKICRKKPRLPGAETYAKRLVLGHRMIWREDFPGDFIFPTLESFIGLKKAIFRQKMAIFVIFGLGLSPRCASLCVGQKTLRRPCFLWSFLLIFNARSCRLEIATLVEPHCGWPTSGAPWGCYSKLLTSYVGIGWDQRRIY